MIRTGQLSAVVLAALLLISTASAQSSRRSRGQMIISRALALSIEPVREELDIDAGQAQAIDQVIASWEKERRQARPDRSAFTFLTPEEKNELREKLAQEAAESSRRADSRVAELLKPAQLQRLDEMILQAKLQLTPVAALRDTLELSAEQEQRLQEVEQEIAKEQGRLRTRILEMVSSGKRDRNEIGRLVRETQQAAAEMALAVITEEQKQLLERLQGAPMKVDLWRIMMGGNRRNHSRERSAGSSKTPPADTSAGDQAEGK